MRSVAKGGVVDANCRSPREAQTKMVVMSRGVFERKEEEPATKVSDGKMKFFMHALGF
jgi:hypothetical protein